LREQNPAEGIVRVGATWLDRDNSLEVGLCHSEIALLQGRNSLRIDLVGLRSGVLGRYSCRERAGHQHDDGTRAQLERKFHSILRLKIVARGKRQLSR
jgi:hypothetical protein